MPYDESLADRVGLTLLELNPPEIVEKRMFGGIGYLVRGNMACGVYQEYLIVRVGPESYEEALHQPGTKQFDITGRPMNGWVMVIDSAVEDDGKLKDWVEKGLSFALSLPPK